MSLLTLLFDRTEASSATEASALSRSHAHAQRSISRAVAFAMEVRESELQIVEHSARVAMISEALGVRMNISEADAFILRTAAELHEVGMYTIPPALLTQSEPYTLEQLATVRGQARVSADLAGVMHGPRVGRLIEHQYEDYDFKPECGWDPDQLLAGILRVADVIAAVTHPRPYQAALSTVDRESMLRCGSGNRFHPSAVQAAMGLAA